MGLCVWVYECIWVCVSAQARGCRRPCADDTAAQQSGAGAPASLSCRFPCILLVPSDVPISCLSHVSVTSSKPACCRSFELLVSGSPTSPPQDPLVVKMTTTKSLCCTSMDAVCAGHQSKGGNSASCEGEEQNQPTKQTTTKHKTETPNQAPPLRTSRVSCCTQG